MQSDHAHLLARELRRRVGGEVRFGDGDRALYATDSSNYRQVPVGVVLPRDAQDVVNTVAVCRDHDVPVLPRGGGTALAGQTCNVAVVIDFSKYMNRVLAIDPERRTAEVEPGIVLDELNRAAGRHGLIFGPDPATHDHCALGGMIGNNACGVHSVMSEFHGPGPRTSDNIESLEILTYDGVRMRVGPTSDAELEQIIREGGRRGEIYSAMRDLRDRYADAIRARFPRLLRRVSGFNLDELLPENGFNVARALTGTEGTCVTVLRATATLIPDPPVRALVVLGYPDIFAAADDVMAVRELKPVGLEGVDKKLIDGMKKKHLHPQDIELLPEGNGWLLVEFGGGTKKEADASAQELMASFRKRAHPPSMRLYDAPFKEAHIWEIRESGLGASARVPNEPDTWEGWEDSAVPVEKFGAYLRDFHKLLESYGYGCPLYGHFGQGLVHTRIDFGLKTAEGVGKYERFGRDAAELVASYGGSMSGEHGDGQSRGEFLNIMFGEELVRAFQELKTIWDPRNKMNPGKAVDPVRLFRRDENLRLGPDYRPRHVSTHFQFPDDNHDFSYAMERCVGVGKCRRHEGGTMCPSYMVTREEKHSTRGRARLLFEMLQGNVIGRDGWRDEAVHEALDLCLACKGCKADCPVNVDMATYKAEFLSHYYEGRLRPITAYTMGLIHWWARIGSHFPAMVNFFTQTPPFSALLKRLGGIAPERPMPPFARETFKAWFFRRPPRNPNGPRVLLWPDTFNNHLLPGAARAAVEVLEAAGFHVIVPRKPLCCGRPLYDYGMLTTAKHLLREILDALRDEIRAGTPMVGLEPSCTAVFRDELHNLFPNDEDAARLREQTLTLAEFLQIKAPDFQLPRLARKALVHGHCHHKAIMKFGAEEKVLERLGLDFEILDSGCCGMAGSFGFERGKYEVSVACGERVLLPKVRQAAKDTLIIAEGFSCREQIGHLTDRRALHLSQVIKMAMDLGTRGPAGNFPERECVEEPSRSPSAAVMLMSALAGAVVAGALRAWWRRNTR